jgi:hypothetical protein
MSQARYVFTVGSEAEARKSASHLAQAFYPDSAKIRDLTSLQCFDGLQPSNLSKMVVLAHGSTTSYGGYHAADFVKLFLARFKENFSSNEMNQVRDLYLIGCDVGLINSEDGGSMAQDIANALDKAGFHQAVVHCVAKPAKSAGDVLYVEVLNCSGSSGLLALTSALSHGGAGSDVQTGYIKAYLLSQADADHIAELERDKHRYYADIARIKRENAFLLVNHVHPEVELNKPHNIFYPRESFENRELRIMRESDGQFSSIHAEAIALLANRSLYLEQKSVVKEKMMAKKLDFLVTQMRLVSDEHWHLMVAEYTRYLKNHVIYGAFFTKDSTTAKLLTALGKKDMKAANKIIDEQQGGKKQQRNLMQQLTRKKPEPRAVDVVPAAPVLPDHLLEKIRDLAVDLDNEIVALRANLFGCFLATKIKTKAAKRAVIQSLQDCTSLPDAKQIARAGLADAAVTAGMMQSRTSALLNEIDQYQPATVASRVLVRRF